MAPAVLAGMEVVRGGKIERRSEMDVEGYMMEKNSTMT